MLRPCAVRGRCLSSYGPRRTRCAHWLPGPRFRLHPLEALAALPALSARRHREPPPSCILDGASGHCRARGGAMLCDAADNFGAKGLVAELDQPAAEGDICDFEHWLVVMELPPSIPDIPRNKFMNSYIPRPGHREVYCCLESSTARDAHWAAGELVAAVLLRQEEGSVMWLMLVPFIPNSILPGIVFGSLAVVMARTGKLSKERQKFVGSLSGWTATVIFMWMPIAETRTNFLNMCNIRGLLAFMMLLTIIGNGLMTCALFMPDLMWYLFDKPL